MGAVEAPNAGRLVSDEGRLPNPLKRPVFEVDDETAGAG